MGSLLVLSLAVVSSLTVMLIATGFVLFRTEIRSLAYWLHAWAALLCAAFVALLIPEYPVIYPVDSSSAASCRPSWSSAPRPMSDAASRPG